MKRLFSLLLILCSFLWGDAQPVIQRSGAANTVNDPRHMASLNSFQPTYSDTTQANLSKGVDSVGAIIYTDDIKGFWYRQGNPKKWVRFSDIVSQTVNNITLLTDSSVNICTGDGSSCDTVTFVTNLTDLTSSYLLNDTALVVCNLTACDTVAIPKQIVYLFQNGLTSVDGIQEWGGTLLHNTEIYGGEKTITFRAHPVYNYVFKVQNMQRYSDGTGLQSWLSAGNGAIDTARDYGNLVRLGLNYTGAAYPAGATNLPGYFGDKIGYFLGTNTTGAGSYGLSVDDDSAKVSGILFHTLDRNYTDAVTVYGKAAPNASLVAQINSGTTLAPDRIATFHNNRNLTFYGYDSTSRNDGVLTKVLGTDASGNVILGRIAATSVSGGTDQHFANTDLSATFHRLHNFHDYHLWIDSVNWWKVNTQTTELYSRNGDLTSGLLGDVTGGVKRIGLFTQDMGAAGLPTHGLNVYVDSLVFNAQPTAGQWMDVRWRNLPSSVSPANKYLVYDTLTKQMAYSDLSVSPSTDTSGRTYYARNGLTAINDSTFELGGLLIKNTEILLNGYWFNMYHTGGADLFLGNNSILGQYSGGYAELTSTGGGSTRISTDSTQFLGSDANGAQMMWLDGDGQLRGIVVQSRGAMKFNGYPATRDDGLSAYALYTDDLDGSVKRGLVAPVMAMVSTSSSATNTFSPGGDYIYTGAGTATYTLPPVTGNSGAVIWVKNGGGGILTLNSNAGANDIYDNAAASSLPMEPGTSMRLVNNGTYWYRFN